MVTLFSEEKAKSIVTDPTRPHSIRNAKSSLETIPSEGVIPTVTPTVAIADTVSHRVSTRGKFSIAEITTDTLQVISRYIINTQEAVLVICSSILRPNASTFFLRKKVVKILMHSTQKVVVLIPPAVEPGEPPINIRQVMTKMPASVISDKLAVLKPAVLLVTD